MNDDTRKLLTEYLGECWHHWILAYRNGPEDVSMRGHKCEHCGEYWCVRPGHDGPIVPKTFSTPTDLYVVYNKMVEKGEWAKFEEFMEDYFISKKYDSEDFVIANKSFTAWLFCLNAPDQIEERLKMAAGWIGGRNEIPEKQAMP